MSWRDGTLVSFDTETTGTNPETARIVTAAVVVIRPDQKPVVREWLVNPGVDIPAEATKVHGVTNEAAQHGIPADEALPNIFMTILTGLANGGNEPGALVIYNAPYDLTLLDREMRRHTGMPAVYDRAPRVVDPLVIDRALDKYRKGKRTLTATSAHYGVPISDHDAHGATADALCAARVAWKLAGVYRDQLADLDTLQVKQATWHREWVEHFAEYQRAKGGTPADISPDWPIRRIPAGVS